MEKKKLYVSQAGTKFLTAIECLFYLSAVVLVIVAIVNSTSIYGENAGLYIALAIAAVIVALFVIPLKKIVKASEYYIAKTEDAYEPVTELPKEG